MNYKTKLDKDSIKYLISDIEILKYKNKPKEKFKQIVVNGIYTQYLVSTYGRILSLNYRGNTGKQRFLRPNHVDNKKKYLSVMISVDGVKKTKNIQRLVAEAFIKNPENKPEVNHIDGNKHNNCVWNLEWNTRKENDHHAMINNLKHVRYGEDIGNNKFTEKDVHKVCKLAITNKYTVNEISIKTGVSYNMVRHILNKKSWKHVTDLYDLSKFKKGKTDKEIDDKIKAIKKVCKMLESNKYTLKEISDFTGIKYGMVNKILLGQCYTYISKDYKLNNYKSKSIKSKSK